MSWSMEGLEAIAGGELYHLHRCSVEVNYIVLLHALYYFMHCITSCIFLNVKMYYDNYIELERYKKIHVYRTLCTYMYVRKLVVEEEK